MVPTPRPSALGSAHGAVDRRRDRAARQRDALAARLKRVPDAPVFYPTVEEFRDPFSYIRSIRDKAAAFGICKIVPPDSEWSPPNVVGAAVAAPVPMDESTDVDRTPKDQTPNPESLSFPTRIQALHQLKKRTGANEDFMGRLRIYLESRQNEGVPFDVSVSGRRRNTNFEFPPSIPMPGFGHGFRREVDLLLLHNIVDEMGGYFPVTDNRLWATVAKELHFNDSTSGTAIRSIYERYLKEFSEAEKLRTVLQHKESQANKKNHDSSSQHGVGFKKRKVDGLKKWHSMVADINCLKCKNGKDDDKLLLCDKCNRGQHIFCLDPPLTIVPPGNVPWYCHKCDPKRGVSFGFTEGESFPLHRFEQFANAFKADWFADNYRKGSDPPDMSSIEAEYWRIIDSGEEAIRVRYGSDLDTKVVGSGFPNPKSWSKHSMRLPDGVDEETYEKYLKNPWNLNIFPELDASVLDCLGTRIKGVSVPWLYFGMLFSSFCWHTEDAYMYSINYMHFGQGKVWYGAPGGMGAAKFEAAFRSTVPELFDAQPDLLFQLVTMIGPHDLIDRGAQICRAVQMPGEFVITFPQAYHGGFSLGFNCAEAVNFATVDWLPFARASAERHRLHERPPIFSVDELVFRVVRSPFFAVNTSRRDAALLYADLKRIVERECRARRGMEELFAKHNKPPQFTEKKASCGVCVHCRQPCFLSAVHHRGEKVMCYQDFSEAVKASEEDGSQRVTESADVEENDEEGVGGKSKRRKYTFPTDPAKTNLLYSLTDADFVSALAVVEKVLDIKRPTGKDLLIVID